MSNPSTLSREEAKALIARQAGIDRVPARFNIISDTTDFFGLEYGDVLVLGDRHYWIRRYEREGRFGLDDEPKYWVRHHARNCAVLVVE